MLPFALHICMGTDLMPASAAPHLSPSQNVSYITVSGQDDDVCAGPLSDTITWVNASAGPGGELLAPATYTPMGYSNRGTGGWICDYAAPSPELNDTSGTQDVALLRYGAWCAPQGESRFLLWGAHLTSAFNAGFSSRL